MYVKKLANGLVVEANANIAKYNSYLAKASTGPNEAMRKFRWETELENNQDKVRFYQQIERNAEWVMGNATIGAQELDKTKVDIQIDVEKIPACIADTELMNKSSKLYKDALLLWEQWQDSEKTYDCDPLPTVAHHEEMCTQANTRDRNCSVKCEVGYDGEGSRNSLRCIKQGEFGKHIFGELTGFATCLGRSCGIPPAIDKAVVLQQEVRYPDAAVYTCADGYTMTGEAAGQRSFSMACSYQGVFPNGEFVKDSSQKCQRVLCGKPMVKHSLSLVHDYFFSDIAEVTCDEGYSVDGLASGLRAFNVTCMANGRFSAAHQCRPIRCGPAPTSFGSQLLTKASGDQFYPAELRYKCDHGYSIDQKPKGVTSFTLKCSSEGDFEWTEHPELHLPACRRVSAGMSPEIPHGFYQRREMFFGDRVWVAAETGYSTDAVPDKGLLFEMTVTAEGTYSGVRQFRPVSCGQKPSINHGTTKFKYPEVSFGDVLTYTCDPGYSWDGTNANAASQFTIQCESDASLSKIPGKGTCVNIDDCLSHTCGPFGSCVDELMNYTCRCDSGFQVTLDVETGERTCGNIDDCGPEACGVGKCIDGVNDYSCQCPYGYEQIETAEEKTCQAVVCGTPPQVGHALTKPINEGTSKVSFPTVVTYQCATGFTLDGKVGGHNHFEISCNGDRHFSATSSCQPISCGASPDYKDSSRSISSAVFDQSVTYTCANGHTIDGTAEGDTSFHVTCQSNGQYTDGFPCQPIDCGEPSLIANAGRPGGARHFGEKVTYSCFEGFSVDGGKNSVKSFTATCGIHGHFEVSGKHECQPIMCGTPSLDLHVLYASIPEKEVFYPQVADITCRDGYSVKGDPHGDTSFTIKCESDGEFEDYDPHTCEAVKCGAVPPMANASLRFVKSVETNLKVNTNTLQFNMKAIYDCLPGFTAGGAAEASKEVHAECKANGEYSLPKPSLICLNVNDCETHTCGAFGQCVDQVGPSPAYTCKCDDGYAMTTLPNGEKRCGNIDDCKGHDCGAGVCKDLVNDYTCICPTGYYIGEEKGVKTCLPVVCDSKAPLAENAALVDKSLADKEFIFSHSLRYQCKEGYSLDGTGNEAAMGFQASCDAEGEVRNLMTCQAIKCGIPHSFAFTHLVNLEPDHHMIFGEKAHYSCDEGYSLGGSANDASEFEVSCLKSGILSDPKACKPITCGSAPEVSNGNAIISGHISYGMTLQYKCDNGYTLSGVKKTDASFTITCGANGQFSALPSAVPCKSVSAGATPKIPNAYLFKYAGQQVGASVESVTAYYPHAVEWKCKPGYTDSGGPAGKTKFVSQVNYMGEYDPPPPAECKLVTYKITGEIKDARNGQGLNGAEAEIVGTGQKVTAVNGFFTLHNVQAATVSIKYTAARYIDNTREITVTGDVNVGGVADISMSPKMDPDQWRATIKWSSYPKDLDTYVKWGWSKTCWYSRYNAASRLSARLEHDDTDGYGPETAYFTGVGRCNGGASSCDMKYMINDYTRTRKMGQKMAEVTLYNGDRTAGTWKIENCQSSVSRDGNWWHVFTIDGKTNKLKWNCHQGASTEVNMMRLGNNETRVDYDSYVGPFPGRYWRHSRRLKHAKIGASATVPARASTLLSKSGH
jgi:hypothetical protein